MHPIIGKNPARGKNAYRSIVKPIANMRRLGMTWGNG
jgi:hypothetical protein